MIINKERNVVFGLLDRNTITGRMKLVSVIIPTYNRAEMLCQCIDSVLKSTYTYLQVIIVDNSSTDNTIELINNKYSDRRIKVVALKENLMAAGGRNEGIKHSTGEYLLFLDNDNIIYPDMIELLVNEMEKDRHIGLVGPISINKSAGDTMWLVSGNYNFFTSRPSNLYSGKRVDEVTLKKRYETCYSPNAMMVSRDAINSVGGFDKSYFAMYEEADFGYRILKAGYKEYIITDARTYHISYVDTNEQEKLRVLGIGFPERAYHYAKNRSVFMKKYGKWYHLLTFYAIFIHVFTVYYSFIALKYGRIDIARAWIKGTVKGIFTKVKKEIKVEL